MSESPSQSEPGLQELLRRCPPSAKGRFIGRLKGLERKADAKHRARIEQSIRADMQRAITGYELRKANTPKVTYAEELPVSERREEIIQAIRDNQVVIVCGETGSGKTTQLPKMCLELGLGVGAMIGHTQPRRIAARSVASRIADELGVKIGEQVGSKIRFSDSTSENTFIKVMTDGILLAETRSDPKLRQYDAIIIDEAHERSLNIDFLLGYLHRVLHSRPDLKLIITSATIDAGRFAEHFGTRGTPAPVIEVSGRTYPVEMRYEPDHIASGMNMDEAASYAAAQLVNERHDDVLVFMPGEREIRQTAHELRKRDHLPLGGGAAAGVQAQRAASDHHRDQCGRDLADGPQHQIGRGPGQRPHEAVQPAHQDPRLAHRAHLPGQREPTRRSVWSNRAGRVCASL